MYKIFKKFNKKNSAQIRAELARAHLIIALLAASLIAILSLGVQQTGSFDPTMSAICVVLLVFIILFSLLMSYNLVKNKK